MDCSGASNGGVMALCELIIGVSSPLIRQFHGLNEKRSEWRESQWSHRVFANHRANRHYLFGYMQ